MFRALSPWSASSGRGLSLSLANRVKQLIALAKANPGKYSYASAGTGQSAHRAKRRRDCDLSGHLLQTAAP